MPSDPNANQPTNSSALVRHLRVVTWNLDHWRRGTQTRRDAWSYLASGLSSDIALLQECVPPRDLSRSHLVYREIGGSRSWGSAVAVFNKELSIEEVGAVRTKYGSTRFPMLGTYPGAMIVARVDIPTVGPITCVSVYGLINVYAQTTMLRIVADLIPLFDSPEGERVVLGGDLNVTTAASPSTELRRYEAILNAVESLGLRNLVETAAERPPQLENCACGASSCHHLRTYGGGQLDWLFATPELAQRCRRLRVEYGQCASLSDHAPIIADFEIPLGIPTRHWDPDSFVQEVGIRHGAAAIRVAEEIIAWAQRMHVQIKEQHAYASLDRLPRQWVPSLSSGFSLTFNIPNALGIPSASLQMTQWSCCSFST